MVEGEEKAERVKLNNNQIYRIENLVSLPVINFLDLSNNLIHIIQNIENLGSLKELHLNNNFIESLDNLSDLKRLERLHVRNNKLKSLKGINELQWLTVLDVSSNVLEDFDVQGLCPSLKNLDISLNKLRSLDTIEQFTRKLKVLSVQQNPLSKNSKGKLVLRHFKELQNLNIDSYMERSLEGLEEDCHINGKLILKRGSTNEGNKNSNTGNDIQMDFQTVKNHTVDLQKNSTMDLNDDDDDDMVNIGVPLTPMPSLQTSTSAKKQIILVKPDEDYKMIEEALNPPGTKSETQEGFLIFL